jgi:hypothetical protein
MSGAPLMTQQGEVIGIISGSLTQGGSIAWAIAIENTRSEFATSVHSPTANLFWPKLTMMPDGWENLRSQTGIGKDLIDAINLSTKAVDAVQISLSSECAADNTVVQGLTNLVQTFDGYPSLLRLQTSVLDQSSGDGHALGTAALNQLNVLSPQMDAASVQLDSTNQAIREAKVRLHALKMTAGVFQQNLPNTPRNSQIIAQLASQSSARDAKLELLSQALTANSDQAHAILATQTTKRDLVYDYRNQYATLLNAWTVYQRNYCNSLPPLYSGFRDRAVDYRLLLAADVLPSQAAVGDNPR